MKVKIANARKITIGENFNNCIKYQKGATYRQPKPIGHCELTEFIQNEDNEELIDIYLKPKEIEGAAQFHWKSISVRMLLEVEYDSSFE